MPLRIGFFLWWAVVGTFSQTEEPVTLATGFV
jgi:hypothetical protein